MTSAAYSSLPRSALTMEVKADRAAFELQSMRQELERANDAGANSAALLEAATKKAADYEVRGPLAGTMGRRALASQSRTMVLCIPCTGARTWPSPLHPLVAHPSCPSLVSPAEATPVHRPRHFPRHHGCQGPGRTPPGVPRGPAAAGARRRVT